MHFKPFDHSTYRLNSRTRNRRQEALNAEPLNLITDTYCRGAFAASCPQAAEISCPLLRRMMTV